MRFECEDYVKMYRKIYEKTYAEIWGNIWGNMLEQLCVAGFQCVILRIESRSTLAKPIQYPVHMQTIRLKYTFMYEMYWVDTIDDICFDFPFSEIFYVPTSTILQFIKSEWTNKRIQYEFDFFLKFYWLYLNMTASIYQSWHAPFWK